MGHPVVTAEGFAGREPELARLRELLAGLHEGVGGVLLVEGEQGIGKSTLLRAGLGQVSATGCRVAWGAADELGLWFPLRLMTECWGTRLWLDGEESAGTEESPGTEARPAVRKAPLPAGDPVLAAAERLLAMVDRLCAQSPVLLVAEDLQWADEASLLVWHELARAVRQLPLLVVGSCRPVPLRADLAQVRRSALGESGTLLALGPMAPSEVAALASGIAGGQPGPKLASLLGQAGGNPLYVRELVDALARGGYLKADGAVAELSGDPALAGVPASLAAAITERLGGLGAEQFDTLRWAAVLGQEFSVTDLAAVSGRSAGELMDPVSQALAAQVLAATGQRLQFRHALIRQSLYEGMPESLRIALHRRAARALSEEGAAPEQVVSHLALVPADGSAWSADWLAGAVPVLAHRAPALTAGLLRATADRLPASSARRTTLEISLLRVTFLLGQDQEAERLGSKLLGRANDADTAAETSWLVAYARIRGSRAETAIGPLKQALGQPLLSEVWAARLRVLQSMALAVTGQAHEAADVARTALAAATRLGDTFAIGYSLHAMIFIDYRRRDVHAVVRHIDAALEAIGNDPDLADLRLLMLSNRVFALEQLDRHAEIDATIGEAVRLAERIGTPRQKGIRVAAAEHYFETGRWDDALAEAEAGPGGTDEVPFVSIREHGLVALLAGHRDDREMANQHLMAVRGEELTAVANRTVMYYLLLARSLAAEQAGQPEQAMSVLVPCLDTEVAATMPERHFLLPTLTRLALAAGDTDTATAAARAAEAEAEREELPIKVAAARRCRGMVAGDADLILAAAAYYESAGRPLQRAESQEDAAVALAASDDLVSARAAFGVATGLYRDLGAGWDLRRAGDRLRFAGIDTAGPASAGQGWDSLTPAEIKVARLVAEGLSNTEVAAELLLSRSTVQVRVSHVLAKLGARSRGEIVSEVIRHRPAT